MKIILNESKPSAQFACNYSITVLSKCSSIISHRSSIFESRHIDLRRSTHHRSSIFEGRHIDHRSIFEGRHIDRDLRRSTHQSSKIEGGNIAPTTQHRTDNAIHSLKGLRYSSPNIVHNGAPYDVSTFEDRCGIIMLLHLLKTLIYTIVVCMRIAPRVCTSVLSFLQCFFVLVIIHVEWSRIQCSTFQCSTTQYNRK